MTNLILSEWIKFRSVRSTLVTLVLGTGLMVLIAVLAGQNADPVREDGRLIVHLTSLTGGVNVAILLFGTLGVQVIGQEYRFNTIRPTFTAEPHRIRVLFAKLIVVTAAAAVASIVMVAFCWLVGTLTVDHFAVAGDDTRVAYGIVLFSIGFTALGVAIGSILRQPIAGILVLLGEAFIVESIVANVVKHSAKWLPFINGFQMTLPTDNGDGGPGDLQSVFGGGVYFFVIVAVLLGIGFYLVERRTRRPVATDRQVERALREVRAACLALPEVTERLSHGAPTFFVRDKKSFVMFHDDHHGDGILGIWCAAAPGVQADLLQSEPDRFYRPAYVGHRGWIGVRLDRAPDWAELRAIVTDAYRQVAPKTLVAQLPH